MDWPRACLTYGQRLDAGRAYATHNRESPTAQAHMSPRGPSSFLQRRSTAFRAIAAWMGVTMSLYRSIATAFGTPEALALADRLAAWHDAMVMHRRRAEGDPGTSCDDECPHEQAGALWREALEVYGERAREFAFLRTCGGIANHQH